MQVGRTNGLELNLDKTLLLRIRGDTDISGPDGNLLKLQRTCICLGGLLSDDGRPASERTRKIGEARRPFQSLSAVWRDANITQKRKKQIIDACIISKLMYGLESVWLLKADRDKLDGFYANCLRPV